MPTHHDEGGSTLRLPPQAYGYDAMGLWVRLSHPDQTCWRYWRGGRVVNEVRSAHDGGGDVEVSWVTDVAELLAGPGERSTLLAAAPGGSVLLEADADVRSLAYAPHGYRDETSARAAPGFNGERFDGGSGCYLLGPGHHRPYSPTLGLFLAPDTASPFRAGGLNTLAYCAGDPINFSDPSGHFLKWILAGVGIALGVVAVVASFGAASAAVGALAAGGIAALTKSGAAAIAATALGTLAVGAEVGALGASEAGDEKAASVLGWVGLGLGIAGAAPAIAKTAMRGATRIARFAQRIGGRRASAASLRGAAGSTRASQAAVAPGIPSPSAASWHAAKVPYAGRLPQTFAVYPVNTTRRMAPTLAANAARRTPAAPLLGRRTPRVRTVSGSSSGSDIGGLADDLAAAEPASAWDWSPPPLKQYPSPAYTTGHLQAGSGDVTRHADVAGHVSAMEAMAAHEQVARRQELLRRVITRWSAMRDRPPSYDQATLPGYDSLGFGG